MCVYLAWIRTSESMPSPLPPRAIAEGDVQRTWEKNRWPNTALQSWIPPTCFEFFFWRQQRRVSGLNSSHEPQSVWLNEQAACFEAAPVGPVVRWRVSESLGSTLKPMGYHIVMGVLSQLTWVFIMATSLVKPTPQVGLLNRIEQ